MGNRWCTIVLAAWLLAPPLAWAQAPTEPADDSLRGELKRFLNDKAVATLHSRSYYFDRENQKLANNFALVTGGGSDCRRAGSTTRFRWGLSDTRPQPVWAPQGPVDTSDGTLLLQPGGYGCFILGQAYASARWQNQTVTAYRQHVDELEVNPHDDRDLPQTFEAYALRGILGKVNYFAGYVAAMRLRNAIQMP